MKKYIFFSILIFTINYQSKMNAQSKTDNPLINAFNTPHQTPPFSKIKPEHFIPAFEEAIKMANEEVDKIVTTKDQPSFDNTIAALDYSGQKLSQVSSIFFNINSADTNPEIQKIAQQISPMLSDFRNDVNLNKALFDRIKIVWEQKDKLKLTTEQMTLLEKTYKRFSRNGALLSEEDQNTLREIDKNLSKLQLTFGENLLAETNAFEMLITNKDELKGLPEAALEAAAALATKKDKKGWLFTLDFPSYQAIMKYADDRRLREIMATAYAKRGFQQNEFNNEKIVKEIVALKLKRANLLGYKSHAHYVLEERMAENPENVQSFLGDLLDKSKPAANKEFKEMQEYASKFGIENLQLWDGTYITEKMKKEKFDLDDETLKPYFKLENVLNGAFQVAYKLYGLKFEKVNDIDVYNPEVEVYNVYDSEGNFISILYTDFFPRKGKRGGAWMTSFKDQWIKDNENSRPQVSIVCNFTRPTETKPSLLTFNEVTTLFHEFGHALHGMLANTTYPGLSGTSVYWDFVELPSQIMENWVTEKETLALFAYHYQTGEPLPAEYVEKIKKSSQFMSGMATLRQLNFGFLDMAWHSQTTVSDASVLDFERKATEKTQIYPTIDNAAVSTSFSHIFQGGYSAGYYSYKWAEVLDADAFEFFKETGIFNPETAKRFREFVLSKGGTEKPMDLYVKFRGKKPEPEALLRRSGLTKTETRKDFPIPSEPKREIKKN